LSAPRRRGQIITFYSYKGGTGRSMAVANVAWILASQGRRVLCIDWDLEAPGLHRYFHPFLDDPELASSPGLIDFLVEFVTAAAHKEETPPSDGRPWFHDYASPLGYAVPVDGPFPEEGMLDLLPAGRQGVSYASYVTSFDWSRFYDKLGGGIFLEAVKERLREEYDHVLIDSRTGLSDTSGICTVQMPDDLVVCYTLNRQSMQGAAAVAASAYSQRLKPSGEPGLRVWPVPMRVELNEKERLERGRDACRALFQRYLMHLPRDKRERYWGQVEVMYQPYFAFEEQLATVVERKHQTNSILSSMEAITAYLTRDKVKELALGERERRTALKRYEAPAPGEAFEVSFPRAVALCYAPGGRALAERIAEGLTERRLGMWFVLLELGSKEQGQGDPHDFSAAMTLVTRGSEDLWDSKAAREFLEEMRGLPLLGILEEGAKTKVYGVGSLPDEWLRVTPDRIGEDIPHLASMMTVLLRNAAPPISDLEDPHKGQWGGLATRNDRELRAEVRAVSDEWFDVRLEVVSTSTPPLAGTVTFHLHPTFVPPVREIEAVDGKASLKLGAWGAFTVGALADGGRTRLELDLAELPDAPPRFKER
jgi:hypothetical protein